MRWTTDGKKYKVTISQFARSLGLDEEDLDRASIHAKPQRKCHEISFMYVSGAPEAQLGTTKGLLPFHEVLNKMFRVTLNPKAGDASTIQG